MSVTERLLRLIVIDENRVLLLDAKKPPEELAGARLTAALRLLELAPAAKEPPAVEGPVPERHWKMPHGITRNATTREQRYPEHARPALSGNSMKVLLTLAGLGGPANSRDVIAKLSPPIPTGTISSKLHALAAGGYLTKTYDGQRNRLTYALTPEAEELITRPVAEESTPS